MSDRTPARFIDGRWVWDVERHDQIKPNEFDIIMGLLETINNKIDNLQFSLAKVYQAYKIDEMK